MKNTNYSVKKRHFGWVLLLAVLLSGSASAHVNHYIGAYAQAGEWSMLPSQSAYSASLGGAGGVGFLYELQAGKKYGTTRFLFDAGVGAIGGLTAYSQSSNMTAVLKDQVDLQRVPFDYYYELKDRKDRYNDIAVQVPVLFGMQYKRFYFLAGVKVYAHMWTQAKYSTKLNTFGRYEQYVDDMRNMPDYQFFNGITKRGSVNTSLNLDMDASFEIGGRIGTLIYSTGYDVPKRTIEYRLAAFVDYGLLDLHTKGTKQALHVTRGYDVNPASPNYVYQSKSMVNNLKMNDIMSTEKFAGKVQNLMVGIKFTILFQLPEEGRCVICRDAYTRSASRGGGRKGMQYEE
jgi:hypothetical protein